MNKTYRKVKGKYFSFEKKYSCYTPVFDSIEELSTWANENLSDLDKVSLISVDADKEIDASKDEMIDELVNLLDSIGKNDRELGLSILHQLYHELVEAPKESNKA